MSEINATEKKMEQSIQLLDNKNLYFNGFSFSLTASDLIIVLLLNDKPIATLNTPFPVGKSLALKISGVFESFEKDTEIKVHTLEEIQKKILEVKNDDKK